MPPSKAFYVTTPIYYVNDSPHIGHAYTTVAGDVLTRWHRQRMDPTWLPHRDGRARHQGPAGGRGERGRPAEWSTAVSQSGAPELSRSTPPTTTSSGRRGHGTAGVRVSGSCSRIAATSTRPPSTAPTAWAARSSSSRGIDRAAFGGQCARSTAGRWQVQEQNWFFRLSEFSDPLLKHYERFPDFISPPVRATRVSFVKQGLRDISMSRSSVSWGIPLAWDADQVTYVWFDALLNYLTAVGYGARPVPARVPSSPRPGRPTFIWWARTSSASTRSSGLRC